jgi:Flp pilus assembly protein TadD
VPLAVLAAAHLLLLELRLPDWRDELALFGRAVRTHPASARAHANLGSTLMELGRLAEAEHHLATAGRLDPDNARIQAEHGSILVNLGQVDEGVRKLEWAGQRMRPDRTMLMNIGIGWTRQGRYEEAAGVLREALARAPDDAPVLDALAMAERKLGRFAEAAALLERAVALDPQRRSCYLNLIGLHYFDRRDPAAGRRWAERFLARFPGAPEAEQTRQLLERGPAPGP